MIKIDNFYSHEGLSMLVVFFVVPYSYQKLWNYNCEKCKWAGKEESHKRLYKKGNQLWSLVLKKLYYAFYIFKWMLGQLKNYTIYFFINFDALKFL